MRSDDTVISVSNLTKIYRIFGHPGDRIKQAVTFGLRRYHKGFTALKDVSFDVRAGETVGILGLNGAGKSTLLQLICGIIKPSSGTVEVKGRVSALLELGAGFNPEFTGRENVYFQGALMGFNKDEMDSRFEDITVFAGIGEFIHQPVRTYSSGMFVRLAFAVAVHVDPVVLVVDEALAVGDSLFRKRCYSRIKQMQEQGLTLVLVSHDHDLINNFTDKVLLLENGVVQFYGNTREATHLYRKTLFENEALRLAEDESITTMPVAPMLPEYGIGGARIDALRILGIEGEPRATFNPGEMLVFKIEVLIEKPIDHLNIAVVIKTLQGFKVYSWGTLNQDIAIWAGRQDGEVFWNKSFRKGEKVSVTLLLECNLGAGSYEVQATVSRELDKHYGAQQVLNWRDEIGFFRVEINSKEYLFGGVCDMHGRALFNG